ncbi:MAG TPA: serine hydrolase domain-containing protein, partial [Saprospiraceae bacterium]|nr:serine hydrolase domain-containing protein [Saprospiraceae bacterium]
MKLNRVWLWFVNILMINTMHSQVINQPDQLAQKIDALVKQYQDLDIFSGVVLVAEKGEPVYQKAFGQSNREHGTANTMSTYFDIGSINKLFTKVLVMQLIEEGKIQPDDLLGKFLNGFPEEAATKVTIKELIDHTSGYGDYMQEPGFFDLPKSEQTIPALVERIRKMPLDFEPGTEWQYSNAGYLLLGGIIEEVTGKPFYQNILDRIVIP